MLPTADAAFASPPPRETGSRAACPGNGLSRRRGGDRAGVGMSTLASLPLMRDATFRGAYEILEELGHGSFGRVYRARQRSTGRDVAVKTIHVPDHQPSGGAEKQAERFQRELRVSAELAHPNIARLIDSGETSDGSLFAIFEHVPGSTLAEIMATEGRLGAREAAHLMGQVLDALSCAHARGIVHRDLTPSNIMVSKTGARRNAVVVDFGLGGFVLDIARRAQTRITATHELIGTPCYAAPEQLRGEPPSPASDLYSWGLVLLECLTGELPVRGASAQEVIHAQLGPEAVPIPRWLATQPLGRVIAEVVAKRRERRSTDVEHLLDALGGIAATEASGARPEGKAERGRRQVTVVCCRLSMTVGEDLVVDVERADELLRAHHAAFTERAAQAGATIAAVLADRVFIVHGYPQALEDDARRAAMLALDIVEESARDGQSGPPGAAQTAIHVGAHTGLVMLRDPEGSHPSHPRELTGLTPQIASRLADLAHPGEALISGETNHLLRGEFASERVAECSLSELSRPMPVYRLKARGRRGTTVESSLAMPETPLVGRQRDLRQLVDGWQAALERRPSTLLVIGEAGIGKSRLLRELRHRVGRPSWVHWSCAPESQTAPLRPAIDALLHLDEPIESLLARLGMDVATALPLLAALLSGPGGKPSAGLALSAERQKELTLEVLLTLLLRMALRQPLVLAVENLHWADPTTLELVRLLIQELRVSTLGDPDEVPRLFLVLTTRPDVIPFSSGESVSLLPLQRLSPADVAEMIQESLHGSPPPPALVDAVVERSEGVPLFVEEIARLMLDSQRRGAPRPSSGGRQLAAEIPTSLRDLLTSRLDRVSAPARHVAQLAAVLGREFRYDVLAALPSRAGDVLEESVAELAAAGLVLRRRSAVGQTHVFRHALLRDAAYESLPRSAREEIHREVARILERQFPELAEQRPDILALHFEEGGELDPASQAWLLAGWQSYRAAAYLEAATQLERGLRLVRGLERTTATQDRELELLVAHGTVLLSTRGWVDPGVEADFSRALDLCQSVGSEPPLMVLYGLWGVLVLRSERAPLGEFLRQIEALAERADDRIVSHFCHSIVGAAAFWRGDFPASHRFLAQALEEYEEFYAAYDGGLYTYAFGFTTLWMIGRADRARELRDAAFALAERRRDPYSLAAVLAFAGTLASECREGDAAKRYGERLMSLATEQRMPAFWAPGAVAFGSGLVANGAVERGIGAIRQGLERYRLLGIMASYSYYQSYLARACLSAGRPLEALAAIDEGLELCERLYARFHAPELWRLRGEVMLRRQDPVTAEEHFRRALALAEHEGAAAYALRAAKSLARILRCDGRAREAQELLAPICSSLIEGRDLPDWREAHALLLEVGGWIAPASDPSSGRV
jgi:TOMM system kinase/cyclase fusion protein